MESMVFDKAAEVAKKTQINITQMEMVGGSRLEAVFIPSDIQKMISGVSEHKTYRVTLLSQDPPNHSAFNVINGAEHLGRDEITAREIANMGFGSEERLMIYGNGDASTKLKALQKVTRTLDDMNVSFADVLNAVEKNVNVADLPKKDMMVEVISQQQEIKADRADVDAPANRPKF